MTNFPTSVRVGYRDFDVVEWDRKDAEASGRYGECDKANAIIRVSTDRGSVKAANTLIHEILHAAWDIGDMPGKVDEEKVVTVLANQLSQVWRDNPGLVAYLTDALGNQG